MADQDKRMQALERENLQLRRAVDELSVLNELATEIGSARELDDVISSIVKRSVKAVGAEQGVINLVGEDASDPAVTLIREQASTGQGAAFSIDQSIIGWMHIYKKPLVVNEPHTDDRFKGITWPDGTRSLLSVPMLANSRLVGVLSLYNKRRGEGFTDSDQRLAAIIAAQSAQVLETARLQEEEKELITMRQQVRLAFDIQTSLLPKGTPDVEGYDIAGTSIPAQEVGGDYFDYITSRDGRLGLTVADVSGKGVPAALLMANVQATLRGQVVHGSDASASMELSNRLLCASVHRGSFVTLFLGMLDPETHRVQYANAGHNLPFVIHGDGSISILEKGGLVLGFMPSHKYGDREMTLAPDDVFVVYSDGVTEAMNPRHDQYEEERLYDLVRGLRGEPAQVIVDRIVEDVKKFADVEPQSDDITVLVTKRLG